MATTFAVTMAIDRCLRCSPSFASSSLPHHLEPLFRMTFPALFPRPSRPVFTPPLSLRHLLEAPFPPSRCSYTPVSLSEVEYDSDATDEGFEYLEEEESSVVRSGIPIPAAAFSSSLPSSKALDLTVKEKKELSAYAHSLGKKLKIQQVGKAGVTPSLATSFVDTLEANEILKLKVHNSCPGEMPEVIRQLEEATGSVAVGQIGRSVILYRPSLKKMEAAEKKKQQVQRFNKQFRRRPIEQSMQRKKPLRGVSHQRRQSAF